MPTRTPAPEYHLLEIKQDPIADPNGERLQAFLAAQFASERAHALRNRSIGWMALVGVGLWLAIALSARRSVTSALLAGFAVTAALVVRALVREWSRRRAARAAMTHVKRQLR